MVRGTPCKLTATPPTTQYRAPDSESAVIACSRNTAHCIEPRPPWRGRRVRGAAARTPTGGNASAAPRTPTGTRPQLRGHPPERVRSSEDTHRSATALPSAHGVIHATSPGQVLKAGFKAHATLYERSGGLLGAWMGLPMLLLTVTGRKSGEARSTPLVYFEDCGRYVVVGSDGAARRDPQWWKNLQVDPRVSAWAVAPSTPWRPWPKARSERACGSAAAASTPCGPATKRAPSDSSPS